MTDPTALIEKLKAAAAGSRKLDYEIRHALTGLSPHPKEIKEISGPMWNEAVLLKGGGASVGSKPLPYTTSLDAVLTLVPEDPANPGKPMLWSIAYDEDGVAGERSFTASLGKGYHDPEFIYGHSAASPALALCIAALRARAAVEVEA